MSDISKKYLDLVQEVLNIHVSEEELIAYLHERLGHSETAEQPKDRHKKTSRNSIGLLYSYFFSEIVIRLSSSLSIEPSKLLNWLGK